jgi:putative addiction module component (TIGR02574 family)
MSNYEAVLNAAKTLPPEQRWQLIDELCAMDADSESLSLSDEGRQVIVRRVDEIQRGDAKTVPWSEILERAIARISGLD